MMHGAVSFQGCVLLHFSVALFPACFAGDHFEGSCQPHVLLPVASITSGVRLLLSDDQCVHAVLLLMPWIQSCA